METIECKHITRVKSLGHALEEEECTFCHQKVQIDRTKDQPRAVITQLGRIGDKIVVPNPNYKLQLGVKDTLDLAAAREGAPSPTVAAEISGRPGKEDPAARLKWFQDHKKEMMDDLIALGTKGFLEKWKIPHQLISSLKRDKYYKEKVAQAPPAPTTLERPKEPWKRLKWYRENKKEMIDDLLTLGNDKFLEKWPVNRQIISHLKRDPYYKKKALAPVLASQGDKPPALPPWNDNWAPEVQIKWLSVYETLITFEEK